MNHRPQPLQAPRTRWFWPSRLLLAAVLLVGMPGRAGAVTGLGNGVFGPKNWSLWNSNTSPPALVYKELIPGTTGNYEYICQSEDQTYAVGCINNAHTAEGLPPSVIAFEDQNTVTGPMESQGLINIIGSDTGFQGGGSAGTPSWTSFSVPNDSGHNFNLNFGLTFYGFCDGGYSIDDAIPPDLCPPDATASPAPDYPTYPSFSIIKTLAGNQTYAYTYIGSSFYDPAIALSLANGETLTFKLTTYNNSPNLTPSLVLDNFNYVQEVPAPLPIAGAAAGFAYSRKLRRRIRQRKNETATILVPS